MKKFLLLIMVLGLMKTSQAQVVLIKGDSTSNINLYGDARLKNIEKTSKPTKQIKNNYRTNGYRIQVYNGPERKIATDIKATIVQSYPGIRSYLLFSNPNYRIRVGDFSNRDDAQDLLRNLSMLYPAAIIVNDVINVAPK